MIVNIIQHNIDVDIRNQNSANPPLRALGFTLNCPLAFRNILHQENSFDRNLVFDKKIVSSLFRVSRNVLFKLSEGSQTLDSFNIRR